MKSRKPMVREGHSLHILEDAYSAPMPSQYARAAGYSIEAGISYSLAASYISDLHRRRLLDSEGNITPLGTEVMNAAHVRRLTQTVAQPEPKVEKKVELTEASLALFKQMCEEAADWSGVPLLSISESEKGNVTDLKRKKLIATEVDEENKNCIWIHFQPKGIEFAKTLGFENLI